MSDLLINPTFDIGPNWDTPLIERLEWRTDIIRARAGTEQRIKLRDKPRQFLEWSFLTHSLAMQQLQSKLQARQANTWRIPLWQHMQILKTNVEANADTIPVDLVSYEFPPTGMIMLYSDSQHYQIMDIDTVDYVNNAVKVKAETKVSQAWPAGALIIPAANGHIQDHINLSRVTADLVLGTIQVQIDDPYVPVLDSSLVLYEGKPLITAEPNRANPLQTSWSREMGMVDFETGVIKPYDLYGFSDIVATNDYLLHDRLAIGYTRGFISHLKGRWKSFLMPTFNCDLYLAANITSGATSFQINNAKFSDFVFHHIQAIAPQTTPMILLWVELKSGARAILNVVNSVESDNGSTETITINKVTLLSGNQLGQSVSSIPLDIIPEDIYRISFLTLNRLESDVVEFTWITPEIMAYAASTRSLAI